MSIQDRTSEFNTLISAATKRLARSGPSSAHQRLLVASPAPGPDAQRKPKNTRGEFARRAADIGKSITDTMGKLERLAMRMWPHPLPRTRAQRLTPTNSRQTQGAL